LLYAPLVYISQVFVGAQVGEWIRGRALQPREGLGRLALGLLILHALSLIPILGWIVWLAVIVWGTGALCLALWNCLRTGGTGAPTPSPAAAV